MTGMMLSSEETPSTKENMASKQSSKVRTTRTEEAVHETDSTIEEKGAYKREEIGRTSEEKACPVLSCRVGQPVCLGPPWAYNPPPIYRTKGKKHSTHLWPQTVQKNPFQVL